MSKLKIGQKVTITPEVNKAWAGEGVVESIEHIYTIVLMTTGKFAGQTGGFDHDEPHPLDTMKIVSIKRSNQKTGLKVYGKVLGESGKEYNFAYIRRSNFRGWICSCESFFFDMFKKKRNCKHLHFVRGQVGRFAATVKN